MNLIELDKKHVWHPFTQELTAPPPLPIVRAEGAALFTDDNQRYLDLISSWWVNLHGHANPVIADAIAKQAHTMEHVIFAGCTHPPAANLAQRISAVLPEGLDRVFFSDNGSSAVEVGLKIAYQHWLNQGETQRRRFLCFEGGYHGDTFGAMAVGNSSGFFKPFEDLLFQVSSLPYPATWDDDADVAAKEAEALAALETYLHAHADETAALILEPLVQGAGGMRMLRASYLKQVVERVQACGIPVIFDEVMTGFGRTGALFACLEVGVSPDIICLSKGLTGGFLPLSLTVCSNRIYRSFLDESFEKALAHSHSFTANPLGCAAALASLDLTLSAECETQRKRIQAQHRAGLDKVAATGRVQHCRLQGTIAAFDIVTDDSGYTSSLGPTLKAAFLEHGLLLRPLGNVVYMLPPYCLSEEDLDRAWDTVREIVLAVTR